MYIKCTAFNKEDNLFAYFSSTYKSAGNKSIVACVRKIIYNNDIILIVIILHYY